MDPETQRWAWGIAIGVVLSLIGALFWLAWGEIKRVAKNLHGLRSVVQRVILTLAAKGIIVRSEDDD